MIKLPGNNNDIENNMEKSPKLKNQKSSIATSSINDNKEKEKENNSLDELVRLKLELFNKEKELILQEDFYNEITLHNLTLEGNIVQETNAGKGNKKREFVFCCPRTALSADCPRNIVRYLPCIFSREGTHPWTL